ncbi:MAG: DUF1611 domain-containing protein [Candidatus Aminicenantes bacterium]|nr:DUF1611 domain-containing protein [Candidatus Aminicenantes bacterium]
MNNSFPEGNAIVFCEGAYGTTYGKTAHGLIRRSKRYSVLCIIDSTQAGRDSGQLLDGRPNGIPVLPDLESALRMAPASKPATHFVIGLAPDGGRLHPDHRQILFQAIEAGLHVDSGLHDFLSEDPDMASFAKKHGVSIRDVRKTPPRNELHFFSGKIEEVRALKVAVLGTDSAVGKRTTAWMLVDGLNVRGITCELIGTGQTAWMQGARYSLLLDSLINDFVSGEIEHAVWSAWTEVKPDVIIIEGQGSLMNPAYPGGFEILAAGRPDVIVLQHAPARKDYDGFPGYPIQPIQTQIKVIELLSNKPVIAIAISHENLRAEKIPKICADIERLTGLPTVDALIEGPDRISGVLQKKLLK